MAERGQARTTAPMLEVAGLNVYYGHSHALQGVELTLEQGVLSVVGRNGMGKTTLCQAVMGLVPPAGGAVVFSCSLLHEVSPMVRGKRYAFLPFLYDDAAAAIREANNPHLGEGIGSYKKTT